MSGIRHFLDIIIVPVFNTIIMFWAAATFAKGEDTGT